MVKSVSMTKEEILKLWVNSQKKGNRTDIEYYYFLLEYKIHA